MGYTKNYVALTKMGYTKNYVALTLHIERTHVGVRHEMLGRLRCLLNVNAS
jgi:hypothetical protein